MYTVVARSTYLKVTTKCFQLYHVIKEQGRGRLFHIVYNFILILTSCATCSLTGLCYIHRKENSNKNYCSIGKINAITWIS